MKSQLAIISVFAFICLAYAASTNSSKPLEANKSDKCVCDKSNNSTAQGLPYDPCTSK